MPSKVEMYSADQYPKNVVPYVGMSMTEKLYSDYHAYTVSKLVSPTCIHVKRNRIRKTSPWPDGESVTEPDENGTELTLILSKYGWKVWGGNSYFITDYCREYRDPNF